MQIYQNKREKLNKEDMDQIEQPIKWQIKLLG